MHTSKPQLAFMRCMLWIWQVRFFTPVIVKERKINEWLAAVEQEMRLTLAKLLAQAVKDVADFRSTTIDQQNFMEWVDKYQAQLVVLASQIRSGFLFVCHFALQFNLNAAVILEASYWSLAK